MTAITLREARFAYRATEPLAAESLATDSVTPDVPLVDALHGITATLEPGSATLITGASGSGKSTVLRLLNGLVPHLTPGDLGGEVVVDGADTARTPLAQLGRHTGTVFQNPRSQFFTATATEEIAFALENVGVAPDEIRDRVQQAATAAGVAELLHRRLDELSGGELQRIACACVVATDAQVLLLDEPTSNLSPEAIVDLRTLLQRLKDDGLTMVIAEHRLHFLDGIVDRVLVIDQGRLARDLPAQEFFAQSDGERRSCGFRSLVPPRLNTATTSVATNAPGLRIRGLSFGYRRSQPVVEIPDLTLPAGAVTAILGPNGAGKSTLARVIAGLERVNAGEILLDGTPLPRQARLACSALVMQDVHRQLFAPSVQAEVTLGLDPNVTVDAHALLGEFDLTEVAERHPLSLSGGQKQRLVVAAAVASGARVYLFDEPTSGVDFRHLCAVTRRLRALAERGAVVIVISHDPEFIAECADLTCQISPYAPGIGNRVRLGRIERPVNAQRKDADAHR